MRAIANELIGFFVFWRSIFRILWKAAFGKHVIGYNVVLKGQAEGQELLLCVKVSPGYAAVAVRE